MNNKPSDSRFPEVVVVQASAGTGKTRALAKRYLYLLMSPAFGGNNTCLRNILAITFTNKATVEMKERIIEFLKKIALDAFSSPEEKEDILGIFREKEKPLRIRASGIMDELIKHYNFFQIKTIDSFINTLLLGSALEIERSASFKIRSDYSRYLGYCLDMVIDSAKQDREVLAVLEDFLQYYLFLENRNRWFPKEDILGLMGSLFRLSNRYGRLFCQSPAKSNDLIKKKIALFEQIKKMNASSPDGVNKTVNNSIARFLNKGQKIFEIKDLPSRFKEAEVPMNKGKNCPADFSKKWKKIHKAVRDVVELESVVSYNPYISLFSRLLRFFHGVCRKEDILFLQELNRTARLLFGLEGLTVAELYYRLATRFKHYLIDEFQDTSVLQWCNLKTMVEEALSSGGSLFYVGDKKQAIYRFRGGESGLFDEVKDSFLRYNVKTRSLRKNWRSHKAIVEFNNRVFSRSNLARVLSAPGIAGKLNNNEEAINEILDVFGDAAQAYNENNLHGYVKIERIDEKDQEERNAIIKGKTLDLIDELENRFDYRDIAVLARDNSEVELITSWLIERDVPVESEKTLNIMENPLIKEILALLRFLHSPIDDLNFAAFIMGDIFSSLTGFNAEVMEDFLFSLHKKGILKKGWSLYRVFRKEHPGIWDQYIDKFFKSVGFISCYELTIGIYQSFGLLNKFKDFQAFLMKLLELIKTKEDEYMGLGELLTYFESAPAEDLYVRVTKSNSVKILTIHKAKGLEFGVVIIPFLRIDISPEIEGRGTKFHIEDERTPALRLIRITDHYRLYSPKLQKIYERDYKKACIDEFNNVYVALTRPKYELYIFIPQRSFSGNNQARYLIPEELSELGKKTLYRSVDSRERQPLFDIAPSRYKDWTGSLQDEFASVMALKNKEKVEEGNILHAILSRIGNCTNQDVEMILKMGVEFARKKFVHSLISSAYTDRVREIINNEDLGNIFFTGPHEVYCEKEVVSRCGRLKRIDRLIVSKDQALIVDYKSSRDDSKERYEQVKEYMQIIKDIYPYHQVRGYLIYLDQPSIEQVDE